MATLTEAPTDRYTVISVDGHAGADAARLPPVPRRHVARRVRRVGRRVREPVRRPARADRVPQLGQRRAARGDRVAGRRRRGAVPEHDPAVLRPGQPHRARADRRRLRAALGRAAGAQPLARRLLRGGAGPARRVRAGVPQRPRRHARRGPLGAGAHATSSAGSCCRTSRRTPSSRRCGTRSTSRCGTCARSSTCVLNIHAGQRPARLRRRRGGAGDHAHRARRGTRTARCGTSSSAACSSATRACASCSPSRG